MGSSCLQSSILLKISFQDPKYDTVSSVRLNSWFVSIIYKLLAHWIHGKTTSSKVKSYILRLNAHGETFGRNLCYFSKGNFVQNLNLTLKYDIDFIHFRWLKLHPNALRIETWRVLGMFLDWRKYWKLQSELFL